MWKSLILITFILGFAACSETTNPVSFSQTPGTGGGSASGTGGVSGATGTAGTGGNTNTGGSGGTGNPGGTGGSASGGGSGGMGGTAGTGTPVSSGSGGSSSSASATTCPGGQPVSFPGAEGFGACTTGGRGGAVYYVTTLAADPAGMTPGSLQWALNQTGPRYILFKVSGVISGAVQLTRSDVTIAGQTSPRGIIVRGFHTTENPYIDHDRGRISSVAHADNWILRHLRTRPAGGGLDDGLRLRYTRNAIVDHVSSANATDEVIEISYSNNITIQNTMLSETLGDHADRGGILINYSNPADGFPLDRISLHHNTWNRIEGRMPELASETPESNGRTINVEVSNNLYWDPGYFMDVTNTTHAGGGDGLPIYYALNYVGNYYYARAGFRFGMAWIPVNAPNHTTTYFADDQFNLYPDRRNYQFVYCCNNYPSESSLPYPNPDSVPSFGRTSRHDFPGITYVPSTTLRDFMRTNVGAFPRDPMDRRLTAPFATGVIDPASPRTNPYNDALSLDFSSSNPATDVDGNGVPDAPTDTDNDGMPDAWETAHGLNPSVPDHNGTTLSSNPANGIAGCTPGYSNLECYLNELAEQRVRTGS